MKKVGLYCFALGLGAIPVWADDNTSTDSKPQFYAGLDVFQGEKALDEEISGPGGSLKFSPDFDTSGFRLKVGLNYSDYLRFQGYLGSESADKQTSEDALSLKNDLVLIGGDVLATLKTNSALTPFILAGAHFSYTSLDDEPGVEYVDDLLQGMGFKAGVGTFINVHNSIEIVLGYDVGYRFWQDIKYVTNFGTVTLEQDSTSNAFYGGLNIHF